MAIDNTVGTIVVQYESSSVDVCTVSRVHLKHNVHYECITINYEWSHNNILLVPLIVFFSNIFCFYSLFCPNLQLPAGLDHYPTTGNSLL